MVELAGAILLVLAALLGIIIAGTILWLVIAEWLYWFRKFQENRIELYGGITGNTVAVLADKAGQK